MTDTVVL